MKCVYCGHYESKVVDSRPTDEGSSIRRRRECLACKKRFTTYEKIDSLPLLVVKKDGERVAFDSDKIRIGIIKACEKRPVPIHDIEELVASIEKTIFNTLRQEITSKEIGELVMRGLKDLDDVAYVRFASVYKEFKDVDTFMKELQNLLEEK
ncbi:MAG: transcriptional regulator NrdR [Eubacteriales bacterium]|nr:transcriptional regulator NrdR [Eubacteriales bacterium]